MLYAGFPPLVPHSTPYLPNFEAFERTAAAGPGFWDFSFYTHPKSAGLCRVTLLEEFRGEFS